MDDTGDSERNSGGAPDAVTRASRRSRRVSAVFLTSCIVALGHPDTLHGQGVAVAAIRGTVTATDSTPTDGATVRIQNTQTGYATETKVAHGRFLLQGLEVGGPYVITVRRPGFLPVRHEGVVVRLGNPVEVRIVMQAQAMVLSGVQVAGTSAFPRINANGGTAMVIGDSLVTGLPTMERNVYDFVRLTPQVSTSIADGRTGVSGLGANHRFNSFLVDGAEERSVSSNVSAAFNTGKSMPVEAVREYEVQVAPYDVRFGDFAGALINTVTRAGTNRLTATSFAYFRNERFGRGGSSENPYDRLQYGFTLAGPIVQDRVHFFVAPEFQHMASPAPGPFIGQPADARPPLPVSPSDIERLTRALGSYGLVAGSGGPVDIGTPLQNLFVRLDAALPRWNGRVTASVRYAGAEQQQFSRTAPDTFNLSSYRWGLAGLTRVTSVRLLTDLPGGRGAFNELSLSATVDRADPTPAVRQPLVRVSIPGTGGTLVTVNAGSAEPAQGRYARSQSLRLRDDASIPLGSNHVVRLGIQSERFRSTRGGINNGYGTWSFTSLDNLELGAAERFDLGLPASQGTPLDGWQHAAWVGDEWLVVPGLLVTLGVRADVLDFASRAPYAPGVDSVFGRRTDAMPRTRLHVSPRLGFTWDLTAARRDQLRGGIGVFTGRPPLSWITPALMSYGTGAGVLRCGPLPTDVGAPPAFEPDYQSAPATCANGGPPLVRQGDVDLLDDDLAMARSLRASLAYDKSLGGQWLATIELLASRHLSDFRFVNLNLQGPQGNDRFGRVLYGSIGATGVAAPVLRSRYAEVIDLVNTSRNNSVNASVKIERRLSDRWGAMASYAWSRTRDVQSLSRVNSPGISLWGDANATAGRHDDPSLATSLYDLPHRITSALTWAASRSLTRFSLLYIGESGHPFTYVSSGANRRGDLNADGSSINDPVYVPRDAMDPLEIQFSGRSDVPGADNSPATQADRVAVQRLALQRFIDGSSCLRANRGRILARNSCREPWTHTTVASIRQSFPFGTRTLDLQLDLYNLLNAIRAHRGLVRIAIPGLLEHVGQVIDPNGSTEPVFRFDTAREEWAITEALSRFQLQMGARLRF